MEVHLQMNPNITKLGKSGHIISFKLNSTISCRANELAIPKTKTNFYEVLSLGSEDVGFDEIKKAYRSMALRYHPDVCPPSEKEQSTKRFMELQKAYETLSNPVSRKMYDYYELGLVDHKAGYGMESFCMEKRRSMFPKEVWENQLSGLKKRSQIRMKRKNNRCHRN
ncbi:hypothetical protein FEM48_Zijuj08G0166300 [Ziziphus jujuba var. spinosa]|uniref:J domain-containing protein n=1 Tax=Ziziphus jujuba var. spinosa TaxID=714518 RepID=A0A978V073_ZIZJJ|nr:hypothetical protein FEM48_Zijuj08G0166300 [Ziziphus jujuba var. spinosa]